jgi:hypothetical protein
MKLFPAGLLLHEAAASPAIGLGCSILIDGFPSPGAFPEPSSFFFLLLPSFSFLYCLFFHFLLSLSLLHHSAKPSTYSSSPLTKIRAAERRD